MQKPLIGFGGILAVQGVAETLPTDGNSVGIVIQIVLGLVSLWKMLKKPKTQNNNGEKQK